MSKFYWIFGGIAGIFSFILEYLLFSGRMGFDKSPSVLLAKLAALLLCIVFAAVLIRKLKGSISVARTILSGFIIALICSVISISGYTYMSYARQDFFAEAKTYSMDRWVEEHPEEATDEAKRKVKAEEIERSYSIQTYTAFTLIGYLVSGLLVSVFTAAFISNKSSLAAS
ncbi:MAG: DUF4199 domain-containing protein [Flavobacteriales bacterium]|nr:DUF4199 domain-containing protein [Flavobacteriales bacterium]